MYTFVYTCICAHTVYTLGGERGGRGVTVILVNFRCFRTRKSNCLNSDKLIKTYFIFYHICLTSISTPVPKSLEAEIKKTDRDPIQGGHPSRLGWDLNGTYQLSAELLSALGTSDWHAYLALLPSADANFTLETELNADVGNYTICKLYGINREENKHTCLHTYTHPYIHMHIYTYVHTRMHT